MAPSTRALVAALGVLAASVGSAGAWTEASRARMLDDALRLSPPAFARLLGVHEEECRASALAMPEVEHTWTTPDAREQAARALEKAVRETVRGITAHRPVVELCRDAGRIALLTADLNDPNRTGRAAGGALPPDAVAEFHRYAASVADRVPLVFWGWRDDLAATEDVARMAGETAARSGRDAEGLRQAFYPAGRRVSASTFDDRSVPFAVASLAYSRTVSDTANLFFFVWKEAGGDLAGTPYRQPQPPPAAGETASVKPGGKKKPAPPPPPAAAKVITNDDLPKVNRKPKPPPKEDPPKEDPR